MLGAASIAVQRTMPAMREAPSATLLALSSRDTAKGNEIAASLQIPRVYVDYDSLLADPDIDAVYVPPQWARIDALLKADAIGAVRSVHLTPAKRFLDLKDIRNDPAAGGGALYDLGAYAIAACNLVFARTPKRVVVALERDPAFGIDRLSSALLDYGTRTRP